jgi:N-hydroxyarylamine O-acetyltransferase
VITDELRRSYLARLGFEYEPPSIDALQRLHRAHLEKVPYETFWLHLGEQWSTDPQAAIERIVNDGRGGYCFHVNGALHELLCALGYQATRHVGTVHGPGGPTLEQYANHLALTVNIEGTTWYLDGGLGDALHEMLPLIEGMYTQGPLVFGLEQHGDEWRLLHDPTLGSFSGMTFSLEPAVADAFEVQHHYLSTSPNSHFAGVVTAQRRDADGTDIVRGLALTRVGSNARTLFFESASEWYAMLADVFGLHLQRVDSNSKRALWDKTYARHIAWQERQASKTLTLD